MSGRGRGAVDRTAAPRGIQAVALHRPNWARRGLKVNPDRPTIVSFDVFETVLVRAIGDPDALFTILGTQLWHDGTSSYPPSQFAAQRHWAYVRARERTQPGDPHIRQVYAELGAGLVWDDRALGHALVRELALEEDLVVPWQPGLQLLEDVRRSGARVVFTSDTYLPREFVEGLLERHAGRRESELVLTSADEGTSKRDGGLFDRLCDRTGVAAQQVLHVGNNERSDIAKARERGLLSRPLTSGNLNRYEQTLERFSTESGGLTSLMAGASRLTRSELREVASSRCYPAATSAVVSGVLAPVVAGFVNWCLLQAERHGLTRLYFLAREGEPLLKVAKALQGPGSGPDLRYLYVSRQAINLSQFEPDDPGNIDWLLTDAEWDTLPNFLARLGLSEGDEAVVACLRECRSRTYPAADRSDVAGLMNCLGDNVHGLRELVAARAQDQREIVTAYLQGAGFFEAESFGFVDVAGVGSQLRSLAGLRGDTGDRGLLFNRYRPPHDYASADVSLPIDAYFSDGAKGLGFRAHPYVATLLELACASNDGTVVGYAFDDSGAAIPCLGRGQAGAEAELQAFVQHGLERFAANLALREVPDSVRWADARMAFSELMRRLWRQPTPAEVSALALFKLEVGSGVVERQPIVSPQRLSDMLGPKNRSTEGRPWFYWHEGSMQESSLPLRTLRHIKLFFESIMR